MIQHRQLVTVFVAVLLVGALLPSGVAVAAAQEETNETNPFDGWLSGEESNDTRDGLIPTSADEAMALVDDVRAGVDVITSSVKGQISRASTGIQGIFGDDDRTNAERAEDFKQAINGNSSTYVNEVNSRDSVNVTTGYDVHEVIIAHEGSDAETVYVVGELNESTDPNTLESMRALNESEFNDTGRSIDHTWLAEGQGANDIDSLAGEIADRIENDRSLGKSYQSELIGKYCGARGLTGAENCDIRSTIWEDTTKEELRNDA